MRHQKFGFMNLSVLFFALMCLIVFACNNQGQTTSDVKDSTATKNLAFAQPDEFPLLWIEKTSVDGAFSVGEVRKIVFVFKWNGTETSLPLLAGYRARMNGVFIGSPNPPIALEPTPSSLSIPIEGLVFLQNLELTRTNYERMPPPAEGSDLPDMLFIPVKDKKNCLKYVLRWGNHTSLPLAPPAAAAAGDGSLNPSPPADPD